MLKHDHPLRVAILCSRRAPGVRNLFAHREWMFHEAWGPLLRGVVRLVATRRMAFGGKPAASGARFPLWDLSDQGGLRMSDHAVRTIGVN